MLLMCNMFFNFYGTVYGTPRDWDKLNLDRFLRE